MKLISCNTCGIVYDQDKVPFPPVYDDDFEIIEVNSEWSSIGEDFVPIITCSCGDTLQKEL